MRSLALLLCIALPAAVFPLSASAQTPGVRDEPIPSSAGAPPAELSAWVLEHLGWADAAPTAMSRALGTVLGWICLPLSLPRSLVGPPEMERRHGTIADWLSRYFGMARPPSSTISVGLDAALIWVSLPFAVLGFIDWPQGGGPDPRAVLTDELGDFVPPRFLVTRSPSSIVNLPLGMAVTRMTIPSQPMPFMFEAEIATSAEADFLEPSRVALTFAPAWIIKRDLTIDDFLERLSGPTSVFDGLAISLAVAPGTAETSRSLGFGAALYNSFSHRRCGPILADEYRLIVARDAFDLYEWTTEFRREIGRLPTGQEIEEKLAEVAGMGMTRQEWTSYATACLERAVSGGHSVGIEVGFVADISREGDVQPEEMDLLLALTFPTGLRGFFTAFRLWEALSLQSPEVDIWLAGAPVVVWKQYAFAMEFDFLLPNSRTYSLSDFDSPIGIEILGSASINLFDQVWFQASFGGSTLRALFAGLAVQIIGGEAPVDQLGHILDSPGRL